MNSCSKADGNKAYPDSHKILKLVCDIYWGLNNIGGGCYHFALVSADV